MTQAAAARRDAAGLVSHFVADLQQPLTPYISPSRFAERSGLSQVRLAQLAGVHRNTVRLNPASEALQDRLREMVRIISSAVELTGDVDQALYWFRNEPIADYRHQTALDLVARGQAEAVLAHLDDLKNGAAG